MKISSTGSSSSSQVGQEYRPCQYGNCRPYEPFVAHAGPHPDDQRERQSDEPPKELGQVSALEIQPDDHNEQIETDVAEPV